MTIQLEIRPELEEKLRENAARRGLSLEQYLAECIEGVSDEEPLPKTPAEAIEYWDRVGARGVFADGEDSAKIARQLRVEEESSRLMAAQR